MSGDQTYRGYRIHFDPPPIPTRNCDWHFAHEDYDGAPNNPGEGPGDHRAGSGPSVEDCKAQIDDIEDDARAEAEEADDRRRDNPLEPDHRRLSV